MQTDFPRRRHSPWLRLAWMSLLVLSCLTAERAAAESRVALVIGNGAYQYAPRLPNPANDATDVAAALKRDGFETILAVDLGKAGMDDATIRFARAARNADVALFYYSGHALQFSNVNYLAPVDAQLADEADLHRMVRLDDIVSDLQQAKNLRILILDSCRDNPLADQLKRSLGATRALPLQRGMAKIDSPQGMIVSFATQSGQTASDGSGRHSPYTDAFLKNIEAPEEIGTIFRRISSDVYDSTNHAQLPELSLSIIGEFYLRGKLDVAVKPAAPPLALPPADAAQRDFEATERVDTVAAWDAYLAVHPSGLYATLAKERRNAAAARVAALSPANPLPAPEPSQAPPSRSGKFGAVVNVNQRFYFSWNWATPEAAEKNAFDRCKPSPSSCRMIAKMSGRQCFALYRPDHGDANAYGWAVRDDLEEAKRVAFDQCGTQGSNCGVSVTFCADGSNQYNKHPL
jgi:hypothetical protein